MSEIEDFLRKVAQKRQQLAQEQQRLQQQQTQQRQPARPSPPPVAGRPVEPRRIPPPSLSKTPSLRSVMDAPIVDAEILDDEDEDVSSADVVRHVAQHLSSREFDERAQHLGEATRRSERRLEDQVQQHFQAGSKAASVRQSADSVSAVAPTAQTFEPEASSSLLQMLQNPANIRNAVLLSEILQRPEERW